MTAVEKVHKAQAKEYEKILKVSRPLQLGLVRRAFADDISARCA